MPRPAQQPSATNERAGCIVLRNEEAAMSDEPVTMTATEAMDRLAAIRVPSLLDTIDWAAIQRDLRALHPGGFKWPDIDTPDKPFIYHRSAAFGTYGPRPTFPAHAYHADNHRTDWAVALHGQE